MKYEVKGKCKCGKTTVKEVATLENIDNGSVLCTKCNKPIEWDGGFSIKRIR